MLESWAEIYRAAGVRRGDRVYFAFSFGPFIGFWMAFEAAARLGALCLPGGGMSSAARLRAIMDNRATVLCCTPTYAMRLAEVAAEEKIDLRQRARQNHHRRRRTGRQHPRPCARASNSSGPARACSIITA